ncbi:MAG: amidohydrolase, partial [Deltaproteobacteria bacterium]
MVWSGSDDDERRRAGVERMSMGAVEPKLIEECAREAAERMSRWRRAIHRRPEIGLDTPETQRTVLAALEELGVPVAATGGECTSVVAEIRGAAGAGGRCVGLRADMDALPVREQTGLEFCSELDGVMHACGHDAHTAMLLGAASVLSSLREQFAGTVRLLFQPGEEGCGGARVMIEEGAADGLDAVFAVHVDPGRPVGTVASRAGTFLAGFDNFEVVFEGSGGHASTPHATRDPIAAIGPFVDGLAHVAARETDPDDRAVLSVTMVQAGDALNVIPRTARCAGTIRTLSRRGGELARERLKRVAAGVAASRDLTADVRLQL